MFSYFIKMYGKNGLAVQLTSILDSQAIASENDPAQSLNKDYNRSQIKDAPHGKPRSDDDYQFDATDQRLMSRGKTFSGGRQIVLNEHDPMLDSLALHLYEQIDQNVKDRQRITAGKKLRAKAKNKKDGRDKAFSIIYFTKRMYFTLLGARVLAYCYQTLLHNKIHIMLPLVFERADTAKVVAAIDQRYLDPEKHEAFILDRCNQMFSDILGTELDLEI